MIDATDITHLTLEQFLALPETLLPTELFDGEVILSPAPSFKHQEIAARVFACVNTLRPDGKTLFAPLDVVLTPGTVAQPDVLWISADNQRCDVRDGRLYGAPDLIVEVLSPSTARKDRTKKFNAYEAAGVPEYWIVEPQLESVEVWVLKDGEYLFQGAYQAPNTFASPILKAAAIPVTDIFPQTA